MAQQENEPRPIMLLFGEGNFSFSKILPKLDIYNDFDIISTDLERNGHADLKSNLEALPRRITPNCPRFFTKFGVDIRYANWKSIFDDCFPKEDLRSLDVIQFNFPWYAKAGINIDLIKAFFEFGRQNLKANGQLKLALVSNQSRHYKNYGFNDENGTFKSIYTDYGFELMSTKHFCKEYPCDQDEYYHVTSASIEDLMFHIRDYGLEYTFTRSE